MLVGITITSITITISLLLVLLGYQALFTLTKERNKKSWWESEIQCCCLKFTYHDNLFLNN